MSQALHLFRLQKLDTQKDQITSRLGIIEKTLAENSHLSAAKREKARADLALETARKDLQRAEETVQVQMIKIEENEAALYGGMVHNPKELQDLQAEVASLKKYLITLEDHQLEAMLALEEREHGQAKAAKDLAQVEAQMAGQHAGLMGERSQLQRELERIDAERKAVAGAIPPGDMQVYEKLRLQKGGVAVATIDDDSCSVCGAILSPAERQAVRSPNQISRCSNCNRILFAG